MKLDDDKLATLVRQEIGAADTWMDAELADEQADNLKYYFGEKFGNEKKGRSQVVTRDVAETVEGIMPELMKLFSGGDNVVQFDPQGPEDEEAAQQATDYINYIFQRRSDGFKILYDWFKDALLMKNGIVKYDWIEEEKPEFATFSGVTDEEIDLFEDDDDIEEVEVEEENDDGTFTIKVKRIKKFGRPCIETIPSEEFRIKQRSRSIQEAEFVAHVTERTLGELIEEGYDEDDLMLGLSLEAGDDTTVENARFADVEEGSSTADGVSASHHDRLIEVIEAYVRVYDEDDKRVKLIRVIQVGNKVLESEEVDRVRFISLSPIMMPHKFTGVAVADLVRDIQELRSGIYRQVMDNLALQNNGRYAAIEGQVNLQDLIDNKIGGIVRMKAQGAVQRLDTPDLSNATLPMLELLDVQKENRTGVSRMTQGLDPNALKSHTGTGQAHQVMSAAQQKILLIARIFAETGVKELMWSLYGMVRQHQTQADLVRLRGKYVEVRPFDWIDRYDMQVTVGIGNGNKDQQLFHLNNIFQMLSAIGNTDSNFLITDENVFNVASEFIRNSGYKDPERFISDPQKVQKPPPQPSVEELALQLEQMKVQASQQEAQQKFQIEQMKLQQREAEAQREHELELAKFAWQKKVEAAEVVVEDQQKRPVGIGD